MRTIKLLFGALIVLLILTVGLPDGEDPAWAFTSKTPISWATTSSGDVWLSEEIEAPFTLVGLTWETGEPQSVSVRYQVDGVWGAWTPVPVETDHGPDPGTAESENQIRGTDIVWVGESDAVQFMAVGPEVEQAEATLIDTTDRTKPLSRRLTDQFQPSTEQAQGAPSQPSINPRSAWDPSNSCAPRSEPSFVQVTHAFVHHTTGSNTETQAQIPGHVLAICLYHRNSNGWDDIGYNYLIDRFGGIWEGRAGGIANGVQGAHTAGFNSYSTGVAFIGEHTSTGPTAAAEASLKNLLAWKFGVHNVDPTNSSILVSKGSNKWPAGSNVLMKPTSGHRDAQATSCPGEACYQRVPTYGAQIDAAWDQVPLSSYQNPIVGDFDGDGTDEAAILRSSNGEWLVTETNETIRAWSSGFSPKSGWISVPGDFNGDGKTDIANYAPGNGTWWISLSTGSRFTTSLWSSGWSPTTGWTVIPGDFNGDGKTDIANYAPGNGTWWISLSTGSRFTTSLWSSGWSPTTGWTVIPGDFNGDGKTDIANYAPGNGTWWISLSTGSRFTTSLWSSGWSPTTGWTAIPGDFNGDGKTDIANLYRASGTWFVSRSTGAGLKTTAWGTLETLDSFGTLFVQNVDNNQRDEIFVVDSYNGSFTRLYSNATKFNISTMIDIPWRTSLGGNTLGRAHSNSSWIYFGQEFQWIRLTGLDKSVGSAVPIDLPRP